MNLFLLAIVVNLGSFAHAQSKEERLKQLFEERNAIVEHQKKVVAAPDDRSVYLDLLKVGMKYYEIGTREKLSKEDWKLILDLKLVMEDMYSIQDSIAKIWPIEGMTEKELVQKLKRMKVPNGNRRSVPLNDPWGTPYRFFIYSENGQYKIISAGSDRKFEKKNFGIAASELNKHDVVRTKTLAEDTVFIMGRNFTQIWDYPKRAQTFLYTRCEPADELEPERMRCW